MPFDVRVLLNCLSFQTARFFNIYRNSLLFTCGLSFHPFTFSSIIPASIVANNSVYNKGTLHAVLQRFNFILPYLKVKLGAPLK